MTYDPTHYAKDRFDEEMYWYGVDLDKTLSNQVWPKPGIGEPIHDNIKKLREVHEAGYKIIIHTSRPWSDYHNIERWLDDHSIPYKEIQCGKPLYVRYVDDKAIPADADSWLPQE